MKLFLCAFEQLFLGVPASWVAEIISQRRSQAVLLERGESPEDAGAPSAADIRLSLPVLLGRPDFPAPHGIVLKDRLPRTVLLAPPIDRDEEIPDERLQPLPELLRGMLPAVGGACFIKEGLVLFLDAGFLLQKIDSLVQGASQ
jgi:hypothetical protein